VSTRAAERVGRSQSAVSQQIAKLERLLGEALLTRGKEISLTPEGEIFLRYAKQIFALQREAIDLFREPELAGEVRFGLPENFASVFLADVLVEFVQIHPRIQLNIECDLTLNLFERFKRREFDMVLVKMSRREDFPNGLDIWSEPLEWVGEPDLAAADEPVPLVLSPQPCVYRASALRRCKTRGRTGAWSSPVPAMREPLPR
jgi:DNA-binding transcriptional LysR family regulator